MLFVFELGVYLKTKCKIYSNTGSVIPISDIGEGDDALLCFTDLRECCKNNHTVGNKPLGNWFYPNKMRIVSDDAFYRNRDRSVVRLHRRVNTTEPPGQYCCEILDATYRLVTLCINVSNSDNFTSPGLMSGDEDCKNTLTSSATQQPVTSIPLITEGRHHYSSMQNTMH